MAKSSSFFGLRKGSTKSLTFQVFRGQQITKDRVTEVANPQTTAQMLQRLKLPIVANARAVLKTLVDHSFEGITYGEPSLKVFSQLNLAKNGIAISSYVPKGAMDCGVSTLQISRGSLDPVTISKSSTSVREMEIPSQATLDVLTGDDAPKAVMTEMTVNQLKWVMNQLGFEEGQQLTILLQRPGEAYQYVGADNSEKTGNYQRFVISRLIFDLTNGDSRWKMKNATGTAADSADTVYITDDFVTLQIGSNLKSAIIYLGDDEPEDDSKPIFAGAAIRSQEVDSVWKRSTAKMVVNTLALEADHPITYEDAVPSYLASTADSNRYLNSGLEGVDITGGNVDE